MINKLKKIILSLLCTSVIGTCLMPDSLTAASETEKTRFDYEKYADKIAKAYLDHAFNRIHGLAQFDVDITTKKPGDNMEGVDISSPCAQALCIALLDVMSFYSRDKSYVKDLKKAIEAFPKFRRQDRMLTNYDLKTNSRQDIFNEHGLWEWWGTPLATPEILSKLKKLIKTYEALYENYVISIPIKETECYLFKETAFRPETEIHHTAAIIQQYLYIYQVTGRKKYITYAENLINTWWKIRNPQTNLTVDWITSDGTLDHNWDLVAYWPLLDAHINFYLITGEEKYLFRAQAFADSLIKYAYQSDKRSFALAIRPDGQIMTRDGLNANMIPEYDEVQVALALLRLYILTGEPEYLKVAKEVAEKWPTKFIYQEDIGMGSLWSTSAGRGFTIHLLLDIYLLTGKEEWKDRAMKIADDLIENYMTPEGFIRYDKHSHLFWAESAYIDVSALLRLPDPSRHTYRSRASIPELMKNKKVTLLKEKEKSE